MLYRNNNEYEKKKDTHRGSGGKRRRIQCCVEKLSENVVWENDGNVARAAGCWWLLELKHLCVCLLLLHLY